MDSTAYSKVLLDSVAFGYRKGACVTTARVARPDAESRIQFAWGVASGRYRQRANGPVKCGATPLRLPHAIGSCSDVMAAGFNRRIRKTVRTVVWEGDRAQSRSLDLIRVCLRLGVHKLRLGLGICAVWLGSGIWAVAGVRNTGGAWG